MNTILISDFKSGERIVGYYIIKAFNLRTSNNNKKYLDMTLMDRSGEINAKIWNVDEKTEKSYGPGLVVKIEGDVTLWNNTMQLKIVRHRLSTDEDAVDLDEFVPAAPLKAEYMYEEILEHIQVISDEEIKKLVETIFVSYKEQLMYYPAAKSNHHAIKGGLLYHILRMLKTGEKLVDVYPINKDLLYAGIILHDIEKINEMNSDEMGIVAEYSRDGQLLGHIIQGIIKIEKVATELGIDEEKYKLIQHMILSHHYHPEYGSPKKPMIPEGELLHYIDMIDARMYDMGKVLDQTEEGAFSDPVFVLDRRRLFRSKLYE
jgi:3'-5' exoribonuclease